MIKAIEVMGIVASAILPTHKLYFPILKFLENLGLGLQLFQILILKTLKIKFKCLAWL